MYILLCHSKATEQVLLQWIYMSAKEEQIEVKELVCDRGDFEEVLHKEAADEALIGIVAFDNAGKTVLQVHDVPKMVINPDVKSIFDFKYEDFHLEGYDPYPAIKGVVAV